MGRSVFLRMLYDQLQTVIERKELEGARVVHKVDQAGDLVIAIIIAAPKDDANKWRAHA